MSKEKKNATADIKEAYFQAEEKALNQADKQLLSPPVESLSEQDRNILDLAKVKRQLSLKEAEKALAQNEAAEVSLKYLILQIYLKYGLNTTEDAIDENGVIRRGALIKNQ